jgi:hypothetical protein
MDDETKAMLTLYSGLAMHALIVNRNLDARPRDLAQRAVRIAEDLVSELEASFEGETMEND